ncbi:MAG: hypothetical protein H8E35_10660 [Ardenticatenia bacterium]|nr:hypothetical protein [Ardenticatenia bacterium]
MKGYDMAGFDVNLKKEAWLDDVQWAFKDDFWSGPWIGPDAEIYATIAEAEAAGIDPDDLAPYLPEEKP